MEEDRGKRLEKWREYRAGNKKRAAVILGLAGLCGGILILWMVWPREETVYRQVRAEKGYLTVGITESGNVSVGVSEQLLDLDISEYSAGTEFDFGMGLMPGIQNGQDNNSSLAGRALEVEEVYVAAGQEIEKGEPLLKLTEESVESIRQELSEDAVKAQNTFEQASASRKQSDLQAKADWDVNRAYGNYAETEYQLSVDALQVSVEDIREQLEEANNNLEEKEEELKENKVLLDEQKEVVSNAEYARESTSREEQLYWWIVAANTVSSAKELVETLESEIEAEENEIETLQEETASLKLELALTEKELRLGETDADIQRKRKQYQYKHAEEIYDTALARSSFEEQKAQEDYEEAKKKLDDFDHVIQNGMIVSDYAGIIAEAGVNAGNSLKQDSSIVSVNDYAEVSVLITVDETDMDSAFLGNGANIIFSAFPDRVWKGEVAEIGDAQINSNTNAAEYSVTVKITGDTSGLYEGMSAEVTLITEESEEVVYVPKRAIIREGTRSYVKYRDEDGNIRKKEVITGFSDGIYVEIEEGLMEGDIVCMESGLQQ